MSILVTGATGLVGNNVVRMLLDQQRAVRVLVRTANPPALAGLNVESAAGDVTDAASLLRACTGVSQVIHCAGHVHLGWSGQDKHRAVNIEGTRNVAVAARTTGARMVHVSSVDALGLGAPADEETPAAGSVLCPYVTSKRAAEQALLEEIQRGLDAVIVNPAFMLGPWDWKPSSGRMLLEVSKGFALLAPPGGNDFCDVRDVAAGILAALERGKTGRRYILGGHALSYLQAWRQFALATGAWPPRGAAPGWILSTAARVGDFAFRVSGHESDVNSASVGLSLLPHHFSSARAKAELDYRNRPLAETIADAWNWFCDHGYARRRRQKQRGQTP